jgi:toxin ParE1/3/4
MKFSISNRAQEDLVGIWKFSARAWGDEHADLYIDLLVLRFSWLTEHRGLWWERSEISSGLYCYREKSHVIYFKGAGELIEIVRVLHKHMDPALNLK